MEKGKKKRPLLILSLLLCLSVISVTGISAATSTTATVPVTLTVSNDYRAVNVTLPASLPIEVINGAVICATDAKITNNSSFTGVRISSLSVTNGEYKVGNYDAFKGEKTIALKINGAITEKEGEMKISSSSFPDIMPGESLPLTYYAKVSIDGKNVEEKEALHLVFTVTSIG